MIACIEGHKKLVELLLNRFPSVLYIRDNKKTTPFIMACIENKIDIVKNFINKFPRVIS